MTMETKDVAELAKLMLTMEEKLREKIVAVLKIENRDVSMSLYVEELHTDQIVMIRAESKFNTRTIKAELTIGIDDSYTSAIDKLVENFARALVVELLQPIVTEALLPRFKNRFKVHK